MLAELYSASLQGEPSIITSKWGYSDPNCGFITPDTHLFTIKILRGAPLYACAPAAPSAATSLQPGQRPAAAVS
jgi:hypothetical protein